MNIFFIKAIKTEKLMNTEKIIDNFMNLRKIDFLQNYNETVAINTLM